MCSVYPVQNVHYRHLPLDAKELEVGRVGRQCPFGVRVTSTAMFTPFIVVTDSCFFVDWFPC